MAAWGMRALWWTLSVGWVAGACGARTGDELPKSLAGNSAGFGGSSSQGPTGGTTLTGSEASAVGVGPVGVANTNAATAMASGTSSIGFGSTDGPAATATLNTATASTTGGGFDQACCAAHASVGCNDPLVVACVCATDPFCCRVAWDEQCVAEIEPLGCGTCENQFGGAGGAVSVVTVSGTGSLVVGSVVSTVSTLSTATSSAGGASSTGTSGEGGSGGVAECVAQAESECGECLCTSCFSQYGDCIGDFGCPVILECIEETGCTTPQDCDQEGTCADVIERFGGLTGASVAYVGQLIACATNAGCACD